MIIPMSTENSID